MPLTKTLANRVRKNLGIRPSGCWEWIGAVNGAGYGHLQHRGKKLLAHRLAYEWHYGPIPKGQVVCHRCDNPICANPEHLFLGTQKDNVRDMVRKGRLSNRSGHNNGQAKLSAEQVAAIRAMPRNINMTAVGKTFGVSRNTVKRVLLGQSYV